MVCTKCNPNPECYDKMCSRNAYKIGMWKDEKQYHMTQYDGLYEGVLRVVDRKRVKAVIESLEKSLDCPIMSRMCYSALQDTRKILEEHLRLTQCMIREYEEKPEHDNEVDSYHVSEYEAMIEREEKRAYECYSEC